MCTLRFACSVCVCVECVPRHVPPDKFLMGCSARSPVIPKQPRCLRKTCALFPGKMDIIMSTEECLRSSPSTWCCAKTATRAEVLRCTCPEIGCSLPTSRWMSVDLPGQAKRKRKRVDNKERVT